MTQAPPPERPGGGSSAISPIPPRRTSRRGLLVGAGAGVLVLLVAGGLYATTRGGAATATPRSSASPTASSSPTTTTTAIPPVTRSGPTAFGVSIRHGTQATAPAIVAKLKEQFGAIPVARVYSTTPPPASWNGDPTLAALGAGSSVVYTFKADPVAVAAGQYDQQVTTFLRSRPAGITVWFGFWHEPEAQVAKGTFTAQQYRDATAHLAPVVDAAGGISTTILMEYTLQPASHRHWQDYYSPAVDVIGWDAYNTGVKAADPVYKPVEKIMSGIVAVAQQTGKPFGIGEFGSTCIPSDPDCSRRAAWLAQLVTAFQTDGARYATYFDQKDTRTGTDFSLSDPPSAQVLRQLMG